MHESLQLITEQGHKGSLWVVHATTPEAREDTAPLALNPKSGLYKPCWFSAWFILARIKEIAEMTSCTLCCQSIKVDRGLIDNGDSTEYYSDSQTINLRSDVWESVPVQQHLSNIYTVECLHTQFYFGAVGSLD